MSSTRYPAAGGGGGGSGTVTSVAMTTPTSVLTVSGSPITTSGTLALSLASASGNKVLASPAGGGSGALALRVLVGADLPLPAVATLGGVFSKAAVSHNFLTSISSADGSVGQAQPAFTDISGTLSLTSQVTGVLPVANGGTNSSTSLNNNRVIVSSGSAIVEASAITASRALVSDSNGIPTNATTTSTEIGYVNGVTSAIQTQLNAKSPTASPTFTGVVTAANILDSGLSASQAVFSDGSKNLVSNAITGSGNVVMSSGPTFSTSITFGNARLDPAVNALGNSGTAKTIDWTSGSIATLTLTGNCTLTLSNPQTGMTYIVQVNTGAGSLSLTWPGTVKNPPTVTQTASKVDIYFLWYDGTNYWMTYNQGQAQ